VSPQSVGFGRQRKRATGPGQTNSDACILGEQSSGCVTASSTAPTYRRQRVLSREGAIYLTQVEADGMGDLRVGLRARVAPSRASQTAGWGRFAPDTGRPSATGVNLTQIDTPLHALVDDLLAVLTPLLRRPQTGEAAAPPPSTRR
jgi:hypothetical protein